MSQCFRWHSFYALFLAAATAVCTPQALAESVTFPRSCQLFDGPPVSLQSPHEISNYMVRFESCQSLHLNPGDSENSWLSIRQFESSGRKYSLLVNPQTLHTELIDRACLQCKEGSAPENSPYSQALAQSLDQPNHTMSNDGLTHGKANKGVYLTVDLCPSHREFDQEIFDNPKVNSRESFPVAVAISGGWIRHHERDLNWLKNQAVDQKLDIVWVNHSLTHPYVPHVPNQNNFLLTQGTSFSKEVLGQEQVMINSGLTPSVFFRFPGLISNGTLMNQLNQWGLLAVGSDAWLALGQKPKAGSVILIHGNGNEPAGVRLFMSLLEGLSNVGSFRSLSQILSE